MTISEVGKDCVGCGSCKDVCRHNAISMQQDDEGFFYPVVDCGMCVDCGACISHCPQMNFSFGENREKEVLAFNAISKLGKLSKQSASGGIFASLAYGFLNKFDDGIVCGASYENNLVHHILIDNEDEIYKIQGSKYVQSQTVEAYQKIKDSLSQGYKVLFGGTPCQVAGLYAFVGKGLSVNLFTVDIICHGVPSPKFFLRNLQLYSHDVSAIKQVQFRKKDLMFKSNSRFCLVLSRHEKMGFWDLLFTKQISYAYDPYFNLFSKGWTLRSSCYQCKYSNLDRIGDITIGDCDSHSLYPNFHPNEATSTVIISTGKGNRLWKDFGHLFDYISLDIIKESIVNKNLIRPFERPKERDYIYHELNSLSVCEIRAKYAKRKSFRFYIGNLLYLLVPQYIIKKMLF